MITGDEADDRGALVPRDGSEVEHLWHFTRL